MRSPKRSFTPEFRTLVVEQLARGGQSLTVVAREFNISPQLLRRWVLNANKAQEIFTAECLPLLQVNELSLLKMENAQLRRENASIRLASVNFSKRKLNDQSARAHRAHTNPTLSDAYNSTAFLCGGNDQVPLAQLTLRSLNGLNMQSGKGTIQTRIAKHYLNLSKSHKKIADYVLSNMFRSATMSIVQLAIAAGISIATANRFARGLGFDSYPKFRAEIVSSLEAIFAPIDNRHNEVAIPAASSQVIASSLNEYMNSLKMSMR